MSELPAGRELDALVAEKVMLWHYVQLAQEPHMGFGVPLPPYSTQIAAAWAVVEKALRPRHAYLAPMIYEEQECWGVFEGDDWFEIAHAETAPLAICRAALKAVGP